MTNTTDKAMREAFEAWAVEEGFAWIEDACEILNEPAKFRWNPYNDCGKAGAWLAWQAALAASAAAPEQADRAQRMRDAGYTRRPTLRAVKPSQIRLWDSQWVNVVNNPEVLSTDTEQAVSLAVKLAEQYMAKNYADNNWPPAIDNERSKA